ncbi:MAG TPA: hypothetical protein VKJ00_03635 [Thermoanaerobaculia bacterium]|nr:hypothetical protein [Thermoanaerobaculia bacterium]HMF08203.1 hypothetical protein [Thermoanaerobaculia bacterium]
MIIPVGLDEDEVRRTIPGARTALDRGLRHPGCVGEWKDTFTKKLSQLPASSPRPGFLPGPTPSA